MTFGHDFRKSLLYQVNKTGKFQKKEGEGERKKQWIFIDGDLWRNVIGMHSLLSIELQQLRQPRPNLQCLCSNSMERNSELRVFLEVNSMGRNLEKEGLLVVNWKLKCYFSTSGHEAVILGGYTKIIKFMNSGRDSELVVAILVIY